MPSPTLALAAVAAIATSASTGPVHADKATPALVAPDLVAGGASLEDQVRVRRHAAHLLRRRHAGARSHKGSGRSAPTPPVLRRIAECASHGNPRSVGGGGAYRGAYQFTVQAWRAVGGSGDPAAAPMTEQTRRAARLLARSGPSQWPACSR